MDRRNFIKSGLLAATVGATMGPKAIAQEANRRVEQEQKAKDILNYNPAMQYRPMGRTGVNVSALGFGMLRLPMKNGHVDFEQTTPMVRRAIEGGVNYIDTGRVYMGGESEQAVKRVVEYTPAWDFCLIQHNYLDYEYEAGVLGPKYAAANGMGLAVMKPVRTGFLANLPQVMRNALASTGIHKPDVEWALDYLWDIPEVSVAVSGMGSMDDVEENLKYAAKARPNMLTSAEREALGAAIYAYRHAPGHIDCTGCYQCIPCPHNVAIGYIFAYVYNNYLLHRNKDRAMADYTVSMSPVQRGDPASSCVSCGECLAKCPQHLDIPNLLAKVKETMGK